MLALVSMLAGAGIALAARPRLLPRPAQRLSARATANFIAAMRSIREGDDTIRLEPIAAGAESRLASGFNAMAQAVGERERALRQNALSDGETGLYNRTALADALEARRGPGRRPLYVAAVRVERFFTLRQKIGYPLAKNVVRELGRRAAACVPGACVGRIGTATVGVGFPAADLAEAVGWLAVLRAAIDPELELCGHFLDVGTAMGLAGSDDGELDAGALLERAELAADQAERSRSGSAIFSIDEFGDPSERLALMRDLRGALTDGQIFLAYQPKYRSRTDEIDAIEALIRWRHPERGMIAPDQFIALAEETGEIRAVTEWVLRQAARDQARLAAGGLNLAMYVNISGRLLGDRQFAGEALALAGAFPGAVGFEITETSVLFDPERALRDLTAFAEAGIRIAIDDYGSGWSSLAYLKKLPAHELKIDRLFVSELTSSQRDPLLVRSTIDLAHALGMEVTAEGVETPSALALLRVMGCDLIQGFLIARPMPVAELETFMRDRDHVQAIVEPVPPLSRTVGYW